MIDPIKNCQKVTELISISYDASLAASQALTVKFHTLICPQCQNFDKNNQILKQMIKQHKESDDTPA